MNTKRTAASLLVLLAIVSGQASAQGLIDRLKSAAEKAAKLAPIGTEKEIEIGRGIAATIAGRYPLSQDTALTAYVNLVGLAVAGESPRSDIAYRFGVLETPEVNALSAPGGYIFITKGALDLIENEAELAGVLAHEIAHVNQKHVLEQIRKADVLAEVKDQANIKGDNFDKVVGHGSGLVFSGLSRGDEDAADSLAVEYAGGAGYAANGLASFVTKLNQRTNEPRVLEVLSSHPFPAERVARMQRIAQRAGSTGVTLADRYKQFVRR